MLTKQQAIILPYYRVDAQAALSMRWPMKAEAAFCIACFIGIGDVF